MPENSKARIRRKAKKKKGAPKRRNPFALEAKMRSGGGFHGQGRPDKQESRTCCRGRIDPSDYEDWRDEVED